MTMTPDAPFPAAERQAPGQGPMRDAAAVWSRVLRDYRASLASQRSVLAQIRAEQEQHDGSTPQAPPARLAVPSFEPPPGIPPLPVELHDEAVELDAETADLLEHARELLASMKPPTSAPVHRSILAPPRPSQMDTRL